MKKLLILTSALFFVACTHTQQAAPEQETATPEAVTVRTGPELYNCHYRTMLTARGDSRQQALENIKSEAAFIGANTIQLMRANDHRVIAEAYNC